MKRQMLVAALLATSFCVPAAASDVLMGYTAYLSEADHYNSRGERLTEYWQIIRQDRANYHRFGIIDTEDQSDQAFNSLDGRAALESLLQAYPTDAATAFAIVDGPELVTVEIYGIDGEVSGVSVMLQ